MRVPDSLLALLPLMPCIILACLTEVPEARNQILYNLPIACLGFFLTTKLIATLKPKMLAKNLFGKDLCKVGTSAADKPIPEALGVVPGTVFLMCIICCQVLYDTDPAKLLNYNSALLSICFMLFLGFADDVLDLPWRYKLLLPPIATLPLLVTYSGSTCIVMPKPLRQFVASAASSACAGDASLGLCEDELTPLGHVLDVVFTVDTRSSGAVVDLGLYYLIYLGFLSVFCTNAINIYAGINGLEAGQSFVVGSAVLAHNLLEIRLADQEAAAADVGSAGAEVAQAHAQSHLFSLILMIPFLATTLGLLRHNWYPSSVFVGDTYCYFAGMTFAVASIHGHYTKTLLLFFTPQLLNFLFSLPQLFKLIPCPRHRLPRFNRKTGLLECSRVPCRSDGKCIYSKLSGALEDPSGGKWGPDCDTSSRVPHAHGPNLTLINAVLALLGPMREDQLVRLLMLVQVFFCLAGFYVRYGLVRLFYDY